MRRHLLIPIAALTLLAGCSDDGDVEVESSTSAPAPSSTTILRPTTSSVGDEAGGPRSYLEETRPGEDSVTLVLHDAGGATRDVYTAPTFVNGDDPAASPILDAEIAPDGTVYVVERTDTSVGNRLGGTRLARIADDGTASTVEENVVASEISPDGTRMAIRVLSPDGDGDGAGLQALRVLDLATGGTEDLWTSPVPVDETGGITVETGFMDPVAWIDDQRTLVVEEGCCDSGAVLLVPATAATAAGGAPETWPAVRGDHATYALGTDADGRVLVQRNTYIGDGIEVAAEISGIEIVALSADGAVSDPIATEPGGLDQPDLARYDLVDSPFPAALEGPSDLFGAGDERTPRRFV